MAGERSKRRKLPARHACVGCRKRKHRCDGERPECGDCRSRGNVCQYLAATTTALDNPTSPRQRSTTPLHEEEYDTDVACGTDGADGYFGDSSTFAFVSKVQPESQLASGIHLQTTDRHEGSLSQSPQFLSGYNGQNERINKRDLQLPQRSLADSLVDGYFDRVHPLYPSFHESSFRAEYENTWVHQDTSALRPSWLALLNIVFALGCEFCDAVPEGEIARTTSPFVARSRNIILSHIYKKGNLEFVQALLLMCHYLQGTLELNECWNLVGLMIRTAFSIGLQLNPDDLSLTTVEKENRKRVWWGCFIIDRTLSMKFGRPPSIQISDADAVPLPLAVDDQYINDQTHAPRQPAGKPSITAFYIHTIKLAMVIDSILRHLYTGTQKNLKPFEANGLNTSTSQRAQVLSNAVLLDGQLQSWWTESPIHLRSDSIEGQIFQRQRNVLLIRYLQIRILLQRPLLLMFSQQELEDDFFRAITMASSQTCLQAARQTVRMIYDQFHRRLLNSLWYNLHYIFTSMGVLLHIKTMDRERLMLLGHPNDEDIIEIGMEFLKAAGKTSGLAAKYSIMLDQVRNQMKHGQLHNGEAERNELAHPATRVYNITSTLASPQSPLHSTLSTVGLSQFPGDIDLDGINFDDLLFGTGIPQNVLSWNHANTGFLL